MGTPLQSTPATGLASKKAKPAARAAQPKTGSGRLSADSIGWYLSNIGRVPLLTAAEEIELAHHVQTMKRLLELPDASLTPRQRHQIRMGGRARPPRTTLCHQQSGRLGLHTCGVRSAHTRLRH